MKGLSDLLICSAEREFDMQAEAETPYGLDGKIDGMIQGSVKPRRAAALRKSVRLIIAASFISVLLISVIYAGCGLIPGFTEKITGGFLSWDFGKDDDGEPFSNRLPEYIPDGWEIHVSSVEENMATTVMFNSEDSSLGYVTITEQKGSRIAIDADGCEKKEVEVREGIAGILYLYEDRMALVFRDGVNIILSARGCSEEELIRIAASIK